ncbi:TAXI family TRAP transporter solute-binding subunit [uncultured Ruegeria sp.]|uniref:TAXI family TRAP transporter solute-binding subunit n=1 Tax=uncultured Ruegeria sp. TaxID=259304 RepID=UPI00261A9B23|nr:TAXI family TRAP transporter solute-binding subunit [uncultured Ruegeria sp.]
MFKTFRSMALSGALAMAATAAFSQDIVFSGVSTTSDDYQLGVVWSGIAREAGIPMTVVENGTVSGMRKAAQGEIDMVGVGAPHYLDAVGGTGKYADDPEALRDGYKDMKAILAMPVGMAQYVARSDTGITDFTDLEGKTVGTGRPGGNAGKVTTTLFDIPDVAVVLEMRFHSHQASLDAWDYVGMRTEPLNGLHVAMNKQVQETRFVLLHEVGPDAV